MTAAKKLREAVQILKALGLPEAQQNERSALTLLALLDLKPSGRWREASAPLRGITPMMNFFAEQYRKRYAPNSRETVRRQTVHQFLEAGLIHANPDDPKRAINSGKNVYQVDPTLLDLVRAFGTREWRKRLETYLASTETLKARYAQERQMARIPITLPQGTKIALSPGGQNVLVEQVIHEFCPRFAPAGVPVYVGDTDDKWAYFDEALLARLGIKIDVHGKMPDVVVHMPDRNWLILVEAVTSHGPVNPKRRRELARLFSGATAKLLYVTAFLSRKALTKYLDDISWETEVWVAEVPSHLIHFDGERLLRPD